jgi:hypothetical protein
MSIYDEIDHAVDLSFWLPEVVPLVLMDLPRVLANVWCWECGKAVQAPSSGAGALYQVHKCVGIEILHLFEWAHPAAYLKQSVIETCANIQKTGQSRGHPWMSLISKFPVSA